MCNPLKGRVFLFAFLGTALLYHFCLGYQLDYWNDLEQVKWESSDSPTYLEVGRWVWGQVPLDQVDFSVALRPVGYPTLLVLCESVSPYALLIFQVFAWLLSQWMLFLIFRGKLGNGWWTLVLTAVSVAFITPVLLSYRALTESTYMALIACACYAAYRNDCTRGSLWMPMALLLMACSVLFRPQSLYITLVLTGFVLVIWRRTPMRWVTVLPGLALIALQVILIYSLFGIPRASIIDSRTADWHLLSLTEALQQRKAKTEAIGEPMTYAIGYLPGPIREKRTAEGWVKAHQMRGTDRVRIYDEFVREQLRSQLTNDPKMLAAAFFTAIRYNMNEPSSFVFHPVRAPILEWISTWQNKLFSRTGLILALLSVLYVLSKLFYRRKIDPLESSALEITAAGIVVFTLAASGFTYWGGDRFTAPLYQPTLLLIAIWCVRLRVIVRPALHWVFTNSGYSRKKRVST